MELGGFLVREVVVFRVCNRLILQPEDDEIGLLHSHTRSCNTHCPHLSGQRPEGTKTTRIFTTNLAQPLIVFLKIAQTFNCFIGFLLWYVKGRYCKNKLGLCSNSGAVLSMDDLLPLVHWDLNTDRTSKISFFGALSWIARNIQDASGVAMTD